MIEVSTDSTESGDRASVFLSLKDLCGILTYILFFFYTGRTCSLKNVVSHICALI